MADFVVSIDGDEEIKLRFRRFGNAVADPRPLYGKIANWFRDEEKEIFKSEGKHYPPKWAALNPDYQRRKFAKVGRKPILEYSGDLKKSLTERPFGIEVITKRAATFGSDVPYAIHHQRGTPFMPARPPLIKPTNKSQRKMQRLVQDALVKEWRS